MTFAIVAFLIGGLSFNANAQDAKTKSKAKVENKKVDYDQMLKEYETTINNYIAAYEKFLKGDKGTSAKTETYLTYQKKALDLQAKLEKAKEQMSETQVALFLKLKGKLAEALKRK